MLRLKQLREERGIPQGKIAEMLNLTQQAVSKWESGKADPDVDAIITLAKYFGVTADYFLGATDTLQPVATAESYIDNLPKVERDTLAAVRRYKSDPYFPKLIALYGEADQRDRELVQHLLSVYEGKDKASLPVGEVKTAG